MSPTYEIAMPNPTATVMYAPIIFFLSLSLRIVVCSCALVVTPVGEMENSASALARSRHVIHFDGFVPSSHLNGHGEFGSASIHILSHAFGHEQPRAEILVQRLHPKRHVHHVANDRVFFALGRTDVAHDRVTRVHRDADLDWGQRAYGREFIELTQDAMGGVHGILMRSEEHTSEP